MEELPSGLTLYELALGGCRGHRFWGVRLLSGQGGGDGEQVGIQARATEESGVLRGRGETKLPPPTLDAPQGPEGARPGHYCFPSKCPADPPLSPLPSLSLFPLALGE